MKIKTMMRFQTALLVACLSACASVPEDLVRTPRVNLSNAQVVDLGFKSQTFLLSFNVANPNPFPLPVSNIRYGVKLDGQRFANGETVCDFTIPAHADTSFAISVELDLLQSAPQLLSLVRDGTHREISYQLNGRFGVNLPLSPTLKYRKNGKIRFNSDTDLKSQLRAQQIFLVDKWRR